MAAAPKSWCNLPNPTLRAADGLIDGNPDAYPGDSVTGVCRREAGRPTGDAQPEAVLRCASQIGSSELGRQLHVSLGA